MEKTKKKTKQCFTVKVLRMFLAHPNYFRSEICCPLRREVRPDDSAKWVARGWKASFSCSAIMVECVYAAG